MTRKKYVATALVIALIMQMPEIIWLTTGDKRWLNKKNEYFSRWFSSIKDCP